MTSAPSPSELLSRLRWGKARCQGALTERRTLGGWFECRAALLSDCSVELPMRPMARAAPPSVPSPFWRRLRACEQEVGAEGSQWALTRKQTLYGRAAHLTVLTLWFLDKSNASSFASAASRPQCEKSMLVCLGWMPQRVMICGISVEATHRMTSAPLPSELLSRLRWGKARCQRALTHKRSRVVGAHSRLSIFVNGRTFTSLSRPDMSWSSLVRPFLRKLQASG